MQQRIDMISSLAQSIKKYDIHEYKAIKDTIEARSRWSKAWLTSRTTHRKCAMPTTERRSSLSAPAWSRLAAVLSSDSGSNNRGCAGRCAEPTPLSLYAVAFSPAVLKTFGPLASGSPQFYLVHPQ